MRWRLEKSRQRKGIGAEGQQTQCANIELCIAVQTTAGSTGLPSAFTALLPSAAEGQEQGGSLAEQSGCFTQPSPSTDHPTQRQPSYWRVEATSSRD